MKLPVLLWLLQGIPECLGDIALALALVGEKLDIRKIAPLGIILAVIMYAVRLLPLAYGVHSIFSMFVIAILLSVFIKVRFSKSLLSALVVVITLAAAETVFLTLILSSTGLSYEQRWKYFCIHCRRLAASCTAVHPCPGHKQMAGQTPQLWREYLMTRYLGEGIARQLGRATGLSAEDTEVVAYGLEYLLSAALGIFITLFAAFLLGLLPETLAVLACWFLIRRLAGERTAPPSGAAQPAAAYRQLQ